MELGLSRSQSFLLHRPAAHGGQSRTGEGSNWELGQFAVLPFSHLQQSQATGRVPPEPAGVSSSGWGPMVVVSFTVPPHRFK